MEGDPWERPRPLPSRHGFCFFIPAEQEAEAKLEFAPKHVEKLEDHPSGAGDASAAAMRRHFFTGSRACCTRKAALMCDVENIILPGASRAGPISCSNPDRPR